MNYRIGHGYDVHKLQKGRELILGGVHIENDGIGLLGHSDADVLAHAVSDCIYVGAAALGDIGKHFPDTDDAYKNADSMVLLSNVCDLLKKNGYSVGNIDATVLAQRPEDLRRILRRCAQTLQKHVKYRCLMSA